MKARVKATGETIEVVFNKHALSVGYPPYQDKEHNKYYHPEQLEWVDNKVNAEPDYWTRLEHQYAGMAMQGILAANATFTANDTAKWSIEYATALVEKLKEESKC